MPLPQFLQSLNGPCRHCGRTRASCAGSTASAVTSTPRASNGEFRDCLNQERQCPQAKTRHQLPGEGRGMLSTPALSSIRSTPGTASCGTPRPPSLRRRHRGLRPGHPGPPCPATPVAQTRERRRSHRAGRPGAGVGHRSPDQRHRAMDDRHRDEEAGTETLATLRLRPPHHVRGRRTGAPGNGGPAGHHGAAHHPGPAGCPGQGRGRWGRSKIPYGGCSAGIHRPHVLIQQSDASGQFQDAPERSLRYKSSGPIPKRR